MELVDLLRLSDAGESQYRVRPIAVASPVAGADWSQTVPGGKLWWPKAVRATLTPSTANVTRSPLLTVDDGTTTVLQLPSNKPIGPTAVETINWAAGGPFNTPPLGVNTRTFQVGNPAAGVDWAQGVPAGKLWTVRGVMATFVASASAGNRFPLLQFGDGTVFPVTYLGGATIAASTTVVFTWTPGPAPSGQASTSTTFVAGMTPITLNPTWQVRTNTLGILAGDQWSAISLFVEESNVGTQYVGLPDFPLLPGYRLRTVTTSLDAADQWSNVGLWVMEVALEGLLERVVYPEEVDLTQVEAPASTPYRGLFT